MEIIVAFEYFEFQILRGNNMLQIFRSCDLLAISKDSETFAFIIFLTCFIPDNSEDISMIY